MQPMEHTDSDALLIIDMQNDFCPGGALAVRDGDAIIPGINALAAQFQHVVLTQDWHPAGHISFASAHPGHQPFETVEVAYGPQTLWPDHCIQDTRGAELHPLLHVPHAELILRKGLRKNMDSYSAFLENDRKTGTGLTSFLREKQIKRLFFCGLAFDFCVGFSALNGAAAGFECIVLDDLSRAVDLPASDTAPGTQDATRSAFATCNVMTLHSSNI